MTIQEACEVIEDLLDRDLKQQHLSNEEFNALNKLLLEAKSVKESNQAPKVPDLTPEDVVKVFVNQVERSYIEYSYDGNVPGPAMRVLERVEINVTAANADIKAKMDLEVDPVTLVTIHGVPDYEETARRVIKYLASGIIEPERGER